MKKYLYVFNYPPEDKELCALEFRTLFKDEFKSKYYLSNKDYSVDKSVFVKAKLDLWGIDADFNKLIEKVAALHKDYQNFKVIYLKNEVTHVDYQESLLRCKDISWGIAGSVNMSRPQHTIAITKLEDQWLCGYYHHGVPSWQKHDDKPNTFSNSLTVSWMYNSLSISCALLITSSKAFLSAFLTKLSIAFFNCSLALRISSGVAFLFL